MDAFLIIITTIFLASANGVLGSFLILRKSVMIADAISHAVLPGLVIGFLISGSKLEGPMLLSAAFTGFICTFLIHLINKSGKLPRDASIGFVFTLLFAIGIILVSKYTSDIQIDADCVLHGELGLIILEPKIHLFGISMFPATTWIGFALCAVIALFVYFCYNVLFITSFDNEFAYTKEIKSSVWDIVLMGILSATCVISFNSVGAILVIGFMVIPSSTAYLITKSLKKMLFYTVCFAIIGCIAGYFVFQLLNTNVSSAIISSMAVCFILVLTISLSKKNLST